MDAFTTLRPGESLRELAERVFDVQDADARAAAEKALETANPLLGEPEPPAGLIVEVPATKSLDPTGAAGPLPAAAAAALLRTVSESLDPFADALRERRRQRRRELKDASKEAGSHEAKAAARKSDEAATALEERRAYINIAEVQERAEAAELPHALREMKRDLDALLDEAFG